MSNCKKSERRLTGYEAVTQPIYHKTMHYKDDVIINNVIYLLKDIGSWTKPKKKKIARNLKMQL